MSMVQCYVHGRGIRTYFFFLRDFFEIIFPSLTEYLFFHCLFPATPPSHGSSLAIPLTHASSPAIPLFPKPQAHASSPAHPQAHASSPCQASASSPCLKPLYFPLLPSILIGFQVGSRLVPGCFQVGRRRRRRLMTTGSLARSLPLTHPGVTYPVRGYPSLRPRTSQPHTHPSARGWE